MVSSIIKRLLSYLMPLVLIVLGCFGIVVVAFEILTMNKRSQDILSCTKLSHRIFGKLWLHLGSRQAVAEEETVVPGLVSRAHGVVLELGPGSGNQLPRFDTSKVSKIYGIEPNVDLHEALQATVKKTKLDDIYTLIPHGAEDVKSFERYGITPNSVDTILSIQVLCSVSDPADVVRHLYQYLKPGGKMIVYEHVQSKDFDTRTLQNVYNTIWPFLMGNCHLNRHTEHYLREAADWARIDLKSPPEEEPWAIFPRVCGELMK